MNRLMPWQFWFIVLAAMCAWPFALNVREYLRVRSVNREVAGPKLRSGPSPELFWVSCLALLLLGSLVAFLLTPMSDSALQVVGRAFTRSKVLQLLFGGVLVSFCFYETVKGWLTGSVELIARGRIGPFEQSTQPKRYWASMVWNATLSLVGLVVLIGLGISK